MKRRKYKIIVKEIPGFWLVCKRFCTQIAINKEEYSRLKFAVEKVNYIYNHIPLKGDFGLDQRIAYEYYKRLETLVN